MANYERRSSRIGTKAWGLSPAKYVQQAVKNCETYLSQKLGGKYELPKQAENPFPTEYAPKDDVSALLEPQYSFSAMPRDGHFRAVLDVFAYLKAKSNSRLIFDQVEPLIGEGFIKCDWLDFYRDAVESIPLNAPKPLGKGVAL